MDSLESDEMSAWNNSVRIWAIWLTASGAWLNDVRDAAKKRQAPRKYLAQELSSNMVGFERKPNKDRDLNLELKMIRVDSNENAASVSR